MSWFVTLAVFGLVLGAMIVIHEFGHFIVAKWCGVRVDVFSVGFGKRLWGVKKGDTDYRISLVPLGGYVRMAGENLDSEATGAPDEFLSKPKWQRFCIAIAGPTANILTAIAIPAVVSMAHHEVYAYLERPALVRAVDIDSPAEKAGIKRGDIIVGIDARENPVWENVEQFALLHPNQTVAVRVKRGDELKELTLHLGSRAIEREKAGYSGLSPTRLVVSTVTPDSPAAEAGLLPGDQLIAVNGTPVVQSQLFQDTVALSNEIQRTKGDPVSLTIERDGKIVEVHGTPRMDGGRLLLGILQTYDGLDLRVEKLGPIDALNSSVDQNIRILSLTKTMLGQVITGQRSFRDTISGPVGIYGAVDQAAKGGTMPVVALMGFLSLNLGVFNLLPIPVLDGGLILMIFLEAVFGLFGRPLSLRLKEKMMQVGLVMLVLLMGFVIYNDIAKLVSSRAPAPQHTQQAKPAPDK